MASIIKNQLVKHLSKFTKNLKPEQISLDVLKGNTKLQLIEINEQVLTDILELPTWLRIKSAFCTGVTVSVPWTRLKTCPIQIFIDEINVEVVLSANHEAKRGENPLGNLAESTSYGFIDKIVENMSLYINAVEINFDSEAFGGSFMLQRLSVESRSPGWGVVQDLRQTRISCSATNRTLMYKQLSWHLLRIEASAKTTKDEKRAKINAPLRLITSGGKIRVALKKNSNDGSVIHARIQTILEDILWVATLPQLRSAISFASYIMSLVQGTPKEVSIVPTPAGQQHRNNVNDERVSDASSNAFKAFFFDQTSYHLHVKKIDLHLCDDANAASFYPPGWDIESGAMQMTLHQVLIDAYPKVISTSDRKTWMSYQIPNPIIRWMHSRLKEHFETIISGIDDQTMKTRLERCWPQLMGFHVVVRMYDLTIQCVSDMNTKKNSLKNLFVSERYVRTIPSDHYVVHFEFANYFHPMTDTLPVPKSAAYLQMGPSCLTFDERTLRWILYVTQNLQSAIEDGKLHVPGDAIPQPPDIRIDLIMPKIIIPLPNPSSDQRLPHRLVVSTSMFSVSSCPLDDNNKSPFRNLNDSARNASVDVGNEVFREHLTAMLSGLVPKECELFYFQTTPSCVDMDYGPSTRGLPLVYDVPVRGAAVVNLENITVFGEPTEEVTLVVDHFQFLQLTRLGACLTEFFDILSADRKHFTGSKHQNSPIVSFLAAIDRVRLHILLTMGPMPSPYDSCPAVVSDMSHSFMDKLSDATSTTPRSTTPSMVRKAETPKCTVPRNQSLEEFPEFPRPAIELGVDNASIIDDSYSIATSLDDEGTFEFDLNATDCPFERPDIAEEALNIDEKTVNDRVYKSIMAKLGNVMVINVEGVQVIGNIANENLNVNGALFGLEITQTMGIIRQEVNELLKKTPLHPVPLSYETPQMIKFNLQSPAGCKTTFLKANVKRLRTALDDEIVTHLSAFAQDDQTSENRLRIEINVTESNIEIVDKKKKKPLKLTITALKIEQEED